MAEKPQLALPGIVPPIELLFEDGEVIEFIDHQWGQLDVFNMPATHYGAGPKPACVCCGVIELRRGNPEARVGTPDSLWRYEDAGGVKISSNIAISCPGEGCTLTAEALERARQNKEELRHTNKQVHRVEKQQYALAAAMEGRITQLEEENKALREQVGTVTQIDMKELAAHLFALAKEAKDQKALESVESKGRVVQIPKELADIIDVVGVPVDPPEDLPGDES